ncbi:MAG: hypothetical protein WDA17_06085, partial [Sphaerochaetaceae bacterium]
MDQNTAVMVKAGTIAVILSFFLYKMTATTTLFIIPLLFVSPKFTNTKWALIPVVVVLIALVGSQLYTYGKLSSEIPLTGVLAVGLYLPVTLLIGAFIWIAFSKRQAFERLLMASAVAGLFGFILAAWIMGNSVSANATRLLYKQTVMQMLPVLFGEGLPLGLT